MLDTCTIFDRIVSSMTDYSSPGSSLQIKLDAFSIMISFNNGRHGYTMQIQAI